MAAHFNELTVALIGGGNMARAIVRGLLAAGHLPGRLLVADPDPEQRQQIVAIHADVSTHADNADAARQANVLVLAVKPQLLPAVAQQLAATKRPASQLIMSVAAGTTLTALREWFGPAAGVVRVMPNQPATIGSGVSGLVASAGLTAESRAIAAYIASSLGLAEWLTDEKLMDAVTAVSGSGPAYFYLLMEHMERTAVELGLSPELAATLTRETALGAARVVIETKSDPAILRAAVTSPGGTTEAALNVFEAAGFRTTVNQALTAARDRSAALGGSTPNASAARPKGK